MVLNLQWGTSQKIVNGIFPQWTYPIAVREVYKIFTNEGFPTSWLQNNDVTVSSPADNSIGTAAANIVTAHIKNGDAVTFAAATTNCFMIGKI